MSRTWKIHTLGGGAWNRPRVYSIAAPTSQGKLDPLQQRYSMFWSLPDEEEDERHYDPATQAQRRRLRRMASIPGNTLWIFEREELVDLWASLLRDRGHPHPIFVPRPCEDAVRGEGIIGVRVPRRPALQRAPNERIVSIPEDVLPELTHKLRTNVFRVREMRTDHHWMVWMMGEFVPCPQWRDAPVDWPMYD